MTWPEAFTTVGIAMAVALVCIRFAAGVDENGGTKLYFLCVVGNSPTQFVFVKIPCC